MRTIQIHKPLESEYTACLFNEFAISESTQSSSFSLGKFLGRLILPAQWFIPKSSATDKDTESVKLINSRLGYCKEYLKIQTYDGALLETIMIVPKETIHNADKCAIIKFNGNNMDCKQHESEMKQTFIKHHTTVVSFNYRGVGESSSVVKQQTDLIVDGIAQVQHLLDLGYDSERIVLDGTSLGGAVATIVAAHFHSINQPIYLYNDRSFSNFAKVAANLLTRELPIINTTSEFTSLKPIASFANWELDAAKAYLAIPEKYKRYTYISKVNSTKRPLCDGDGVIPHESSLHIAVKGKIGQEALPIKLVPNLSLFKMEGSPKKISGHNLPRTHLIETDGKKTGQEKFDEYVHNIFKT